MSNTGRSKKLASFNCDESLWSEFRLRCQEQGTTATATLIQFIQLYIDGSLDNLDVNTLDKRFDERVKVSVDSYLATHLGALHTKITTPSDLIAFLEGQLSAYSLSPTPTKSKNAKKEPEFWFIQQRAKHIGLEISANQRMKIEMWANESYKERHGQIPKKQFSRGAQATVYPAADKDILDATIKGVVTGG